MLANNNLKVCWTLVKRDFRFHRAKNLILALAAMLVTALYTFVFLMGSSVQDAFLLNYQYTYGSTSHILFTGLTEHQAELLSQHVNVKSTVRLSTLGQLSDPMIGQRSVKLAVTAQAYAETVLSLPTTRLVFFRATMAINRPIPPLIAFFRGRGMALTMASRAPVAVRMINSTPEINTAARPACQL